MTIIGRTINKKYKIFDFFQEIPVSFTFLHDSLSVARCKQVFTADIKSLIVGAVVELEASFKVPVLAIFDIDLFTKHKFQVCTLM